jgi:hypothetical protein
LNRVRSSGGRTGESRSLPPTGTWHRPVLVSPSSPLAFHISIFLLLLPIKKENIVNKMSRTNTYSLIFSHTNISYLCFRAVVLFALFFDHFRQREDFCETMGFVVFILFISFVSVGKFRFIFLGACIATTISPILLQ